MVNDSIALFIPLLIAVVTALASFLRESVDLITTVKEKRASFPFLSLITPPLGRFSFIHISNILLLLIGIRIIKSLSTDEVTALFGSLILGLFLLIIPIIEIEEYRIILNEDNSDWLYPRSYY